MDRLRPLWAGNVTANAQHIDKPITELPNYKCKRPALIVGAGFNLDTALSAVSPLRHTNRKRDNLPADKLVIIATDKALPICWQYGVTPDYAVSLNTEKTSAVDLANWYEHISPETKLILPVTAHHGHVLEWKARGGGDIYWMVPSNIDPEFAKEFAEMFGMEAIGRGSNAGEFAYLMAAYMGCNPIGLIGMPYAYKTLWDVLHIQSQDKFDYHHFYVKETGSCYTTLGFMDQRVEFLEVVKHFSNNIKTYNCTEGGILYSNTCQRKTIEDFLEDVK